jgi:hypothetical protein
MELAGRIRWLALVAPVALAVAATLGRPAPPGAQAARPPAEPAASPPVDRACAADLDRGTAGAAGGAWYRMEPVLDAGGTLAGQRLTVGRGGASWSVSLPPESFASGPVGGRVLVGDDDGRRSRLRTLDAARGCWSDVGATSDVVRSALLVPGGRVFEHRVERTTRQDLGVWERDPAAGLRGVSALLAGLPDDAGYGPTFTTSLLAAPDGRLVVSSCGIRACRTRVVDPASGRTASVARTGPAVGLAGGRLVALEACEGLPCTLASFDLASGAATPLDDVDGPAVVAPDATGTVVVADDGGLGVLELDAPTLDAAVPGTSGLAPLLAASTADSGAEPQSGRIAVAPGGRVTDPSAIRFLDPSALQLTEEVLP